LRVGGTEMLRMPSVYHGFVKRSVLEALYADVHTYFPGPSPDMANAVGVVFYARRCLYVDFPFVISGHSGPSAGGLGSQRKHHGEIAKQEHLPTNTLSTWMKEIPVFWSLPTIYAQSVAHATSKLRGGRSANIDYACLYAKCFLYEPRYWRETYTAMRTNKAPGFWLAFRVANETIRLMVWRGRVFLSNLIKYLQKDRRGHPSSNISEAVANARERLALILPGYEPPMQLLKKPKSDRPPLTGPL
jgi:hypothetical protein